MIFLVGMSHKTAPIELREKIAVTDLRRHAFDAFLANGGGIREQVILSTCNRTEIYGDAEDSEAAVGHVMRAFAEFSGQPSQVLEGGAHLFFGTEAVRHLFCVTAGLDSMALGETEILGQVKDAYLRAKEAGRTSGRMNALFQRALQVGKAARTRTPIGAGRVSVASIAVDLALKIFSSLKSKRILLVGSGQTARALCAALAGKGAKEIVIANRNQERAEGLVEEFGGRAVPFDQVDAEAAASDIVITSAGSTHAFIPRERAAGWMSRKNRSSLFIIDLGVPRNVFGDVGELSDVYLYNLDDLQTIAERNARSRKEAVAVCETIVNAAVERFINRPEPNTPLANRLHGGSVE